MKKPIIIFGAGPIAELAHYYFEEEGGRSVAAFTVNNDYLEGETMCGKPLIAFESVSNDYPPTAFDMFVALSYTGMNEVRAQKCRDAKGLGYNLASFISANSYMAKNVEVGENCFILEDNTIQPFVKIGNGVTLWSGNHVGHHSVIEDNCFISSHVVISGGVTVSRNCFLGVNATLRDHITLAPFTLVGAGALVVANTEEYGVYTSVPAVLSKIPSNKLKKI